MFFTAIQLTELTDHQAVLLGEPRCFGFGLHGFIKEFFLLTKQAFHFDVRRGQLTGSLTAETLFAVLGEFRNHTEEAPGHARLTRTHGNGKRRKKTIGASKVADCAGNARRHWKKTKEFSGREQREGELVL